MKDVWVTRDSIGLKGILLNLFLEPNLLLWKSTHHTIIENIDLNWTFEAAFART